MRASFDRLYRQMQKPYQALNRVEISTSAILHNFDLLKRLNPKTDPIPVLKANAYGHGLEPMAQALSRRKFPYLAVDGYFEALRIRRLSRQPILIMGAIHPQNLGRLNFKMGAMTAGDLGQLQNLAALRRRLKIHLDINTGMNRQGIEPSEVRAALDIFHKHPGLELEGVMSHFADADNPDNTYTVRQTKLFDQTVKAILASGFKPRYLHLAQTAGSLKVNSRLANAIRPGIGLYGINPLAHTDPAFDKLARLKPALKLVSTISKIIDLEAGESVSYNRTYKASKPIRVGVLPLGYYEGVPRSLSNRGWVKQQARYLDIIGRVCMNHTLLKLSHAPQLWEEVTVFSNQQPDRNSIASLCRRFDLFAYELLVDISPDIRRQLVA